MKKEAEKKTTRTAPRRETRAKQQARIVHAIIEQVEHKLTHELEKASLGDYIKLVQLEKELEEDDPRDIQVSWVEPVAEPVPETEPVKSESGE